LTEIEKKPNWAAKFDEASRKAVIDNWLNQVDEDTVDGYRSHFDQFLRWLKTQKGFEKTTPYELLKMQRANNRSDPTADNDTPELVLPKMFKNYCNSLPGLTYLSKVKAWTVIRSFFKYNDCSFPDVQSVKIRSKQEGTKSKLTLEIIKQGISAAKVRDKSWLLVKWQSFQDQERLDYLNTHLAEHVVSEIGKGSQLIRLDFLGRKQEEGKPAGEYFTFIGKDAIDALKQHLSLYKWEKGMPLWLSNHGTPIAVSSYDTVWREGILERIGLVIKENGKFGPTGRTGMGLHEFRDIAKSLLHRKARPEGFDMDCIKFFMGHVKQIDPNTYDKFYTDTEYMEEQYKLAERWLNIVSNPSPNGNGNQEERIRALEEQVRAMAMREAAAISAATDEEGMDILLGKKKLEEEAQQKPKKLDFKKIVGRD
jgi:hypothetical protein